MSLSSAIVSLTPDKFTREKVISEGTFGVVYLAREKSTQKLYAVKVLKNWTDSDQEQASFFREVEILLSLHHPCVVGFRGWNLNEPQTQKPAIITEFLENGSLWNVFNNQRRGIPVPFWNDTCKMKAIFGVAVGMNYLHNRNIIHRDLKPGNILFNSHYEPVITDFGLSKSFQEGEEQNQSMWGGTLQWMAPEILQKKPFGLPVDVYAFAMVVYEILSGEQPYGLQCNQYLLPQNVINGLRPKFPDSQEMFPEFYRRLCNECWDADENTRPTFEMIVDHFIHSAHDCLLPHADYAQFCEYVSRITNQTMQETPQKQRSNPAIEKYKYAQKLLTGNGVLQNSEAAFNNFVAAAAEGYPPAQTEVGKFYYFGKQPLPKADFSIAFTYFNKAALQGDGEGLAYYGILLYYGQGVQKSETMAKEYFFQSAQMNNPLGMYLYGNYIYKHENNFEEAILYILAAAEHNLIDACEFIYQTLHDERVLKSLALRGVTNAQYYLGIMLYYGGNVSDGIVVLKDAYSQGHEKAGEALRALQINV